MDEQALIKLAQSEDLTAFNRLVLTYQDQAYNLAYRILGDPQLADDAAQNAFIAAYRHLKGFRGGSFKAWILRIVTNACYDELRRQKRQPTVSIEPLTSYGEEVESPAWLEDPGERPEQTADRAELAAAIQQCILSLPDEFRAVIVLVDVEGMDYAEASTVLGRPLGTVKSRLARARLRVQECLQGFGELLPSLSV